MKPSLTAIARFTVLACALQGFGCASASHTTSASQSASTSWLARGKTDVIHVRSLDPQANLYVDGQPIGKGAGVATVARDHTPVITASKNGCATGMLDVGSTFNPSSIRDYTDDAPLLSILGDSIGLSRDTGKADPHSYIVTPICPPAASPSA